MQTPNRRVDVHCHFLPEFYRQALVESGHSKPDGISKIPDWNEQDALKTMDQLGIDFSYLSISSPGVWLKDEEFSAKLARWVNEEGARLKADHPDRFGHFASLPLPAIEASMAELEYALDVLSADGVVMYTNHDGVYLGDPKLAPVYEALNERNAIVFIHPTSPVVGQCCRMDASYPRPMLEFMFETTRSVADMLITGVPVDYPNLRIIVPHAGAALPLLSARIDMCIPLFTEAAQDEQANIRAMLNDLYFDLAGACVPDMLESLMNVADPQKILYGSDYPFTPIDICQELKALLDTTPKFSAPMRQAIYENAQNLAAGVGGAPKRSALKVS